MVNKKSVCLIGMFPPPLHGMSLVNKCVRDKVSLNETPLIIDYSPQNLSRSFMVRFGKALRVIQCLHKLLTYLILGRVGSVYIGLSGGNGQIYDAIFALLCRVYSRRLYLHHHSYQYLHHTRWISKLLFSISGGDAVHVVACERMASDLKRLYPTVSDIRIISGISAIDPFLETFPERKNIRTIGFLSNISVEKGVLDFLDVASWASSNNKNLKFLLAGPYQDVHVMKLVESRIASLNNILYIGAVYDTKKLCFFDAIDVFLFPTKYINESEGLVIHEAMSRAVPVIAFSRGCIEDIVTDSVGLSLTPSSNYVSAAVDKIDYWLANPNEFQVISQSAFEHYFSARETHVSRMNCLCQELIYEVS